MALAPFPISSPTMDARFVILIPLLRLTIPLNMISNRERSLTLSNLTPETLLWSLEGAIWVGRVSLCTERGTSEGLILSILKTPWTEHSLRGMLHSVGFHSNNLMLPCSVTNIFVIGEGIKPWISLPKGKGTKLTISEERDVRRKRAAEQ